MLLLVEAFSPHGTPPIAKTNLGNHASKLMATNPPQSGFHKTLVLVGFWWY